MIEIGNTKGAFSVNKYSAHLVHFVMFESGGLNFYSQDYIDDYFRFARLWFHEKGYEPIVDLWETFNKEKHPYFYFQKIKEKELKKLVKEFDLASEI